MIAVLITTDLPGGRLLARRARPVAHLGRPRLPQPRARRDATRPPRSAPTRPSSHIDGSALVVLAGGHRQRRARRPRDLPRRLPAARRQAQLRPAHADRHARARADRREPDPRPVRAPAPGVSRDLQLAADVQHRRHQRHEPTRRAPCSRRSCWWRPSSYSSEGSRIGLGVRALTQNVEGARLVGIDRRTAALAILLVSGALVGVAAVLLGPVYFVSYDNGLQPMIKGLTVAMLGGLGSVRGTVVAAVIVAFVEAMTATYIGAERRARVALRADRRRAARAAARNRGHPGDDACVRSSTSPSGPS